MFSIRTESKPALRVLGCHHSGSYLEISKTIETTCTLLNRHDLWPHVTAMTEVYFDDPQLREEAELRSFAGFQIFSEPSLPDALSITSINEGRYAILDLKGPYSQIQHAQDYLMHEWFPRSGNKPRKSPLLKVYLNDPSRTPESELLTEICLPIA